MKNPKILLSLIIGLALFLRVFKLDTIPVSLFGDEIDVGLQAYSLLKTGKDYYGNFLPFMVQSFTEARLPIFIYSDIPFIALFGLNEWGVRLVGVFWGLVSLIGIYLLTKKIFNQKIGLISLFFLAISPWHLHFSRQGGMEPLVVLSLITWGTWAFIRGLENARWLFLSIFLFVLSFYSYAIATLFTPLYVISLFLLFRDKLLRLGQSKLFLILLTGFIVLIPFLILTLQGKTLERSSKISIFTDRTIKDEIVYRRKIEQDGFLPQLFHNKPESFLSQITKNYLTILSSPFLFLNGDPNLRHSVADRGEFYYFELLLLLMGIFVLIKSWEAQDFRGRKFVTILIFWLFLGALPPAFSISGGYHAARGILILLPLTIFTAMGLNYLLNKQKDLRFKALFTGVILVGLINLSFYFHRYYVDWAKDSWRFWQDGYKEAITFISKVDGNYSRIYFNNSYEPALPRFLFWYGYDPSIFQKEFKSDETLGEVAEDFEGFRLGEKYFFGAMTDLDKYRGLDRLLKQGEVYMVSSQDEASSSDWRINPPGNIVVLKTIVNPFDKPIFYVVTKK